MRYYKAVFLSLFLIIALSCSKSPSEKEDPRFSDKRVVLQLGDDKLTLGEIEKRYATTPFENVTQEYEVKAGFVEGFLERFLLMKGAREKGIEAEPDSQAFRYTLLKQLYNDEIMKKIKITDGEIEKFFNKYGGELQTGRIQVADSALADSLYKALKAGAEFEKLAQDFSLDQISAKKGGSLGYAPYGRYEDRYQEVAFDMKMGEISRPVHTRTGWHIIKIFDRIKDTPEDLAKEKDKYREMTHQYLQKKTVREFIGRLRKEFHYRISQPTLEMLLHKADSVKASGSRPAGLPSSAYLDPAAFNQAERNIYMVEFDGGGATVSEYLDNLKAYDPVRAPELRETELLDEVLEGLASPAMLMKKALLLGLDKTETFTGEIEYLKGNYLSQKMRDMIYSDLRMIEEADIVKYYNEHRDDFYLPDQVRVQAISVKTREEAESLLGRIKGGANFAQMARKHSLDKKTAVQGGDLNFFTAARYTPIYNAAEGMPNGTLGGPVEMDGNWWIFQVLERITRKPKELDLVRADVTSLIGQEWRANAYNDWITKMKERTQYKMDLDLIRNNLRMGSLPSDAAKSKG